MLKERLRPFVRGSIAYKKKNALKHFWISLIQLVKNSISSRIAISVHQMIRRSTLSSTKKLKTKKAMEVVSLLLFKYQNLSIVRLSKLTCPQRIL